MALELGPCQVLFGSAGSEVDMGKTFGGVTVRITDDSVDLKSDQYGSAPEDTVITGTMVEVELSIAELTITNMSTALGQTDGTDFVAGENKTGTQLLASAQSLLLKKYVDGAPSSSVADHITFPAAGMVSNVEMSYDAENQRVMRMTFKCFPKSVSAAWGTGTPFEKTINYWIGDNTQTS